MEEKVYIIILNWNGWKDTLECLESVFRNDYPNYQVVVCDNGSQDGSIEKIKAWAEGNNENTSLSDNDTIRALTFPPIQKPVRYVEYERAEAELGGKKDDDFKMILIHTGGNLGFAGGNNVGLRYVLRKKDFSYVWLLNNDTVIKSNALTNLVERMKESPEAGICGSTLVYYHTPNLVQAQSGAKYNKWLARSTHIGLYRPVEQLIDFKKVENQINYIVGASMFVSREFLQVVGLMSEEYFLYFEELDWAIRANGQYSLVYASDSVIYHKEGSSIGSSSNPLEKSFISDYYDIKNRLLLTRKYYPLCLPVVYSALLIVLLNRIRRRQWKKARMVFKIIFKF